MYTNIVVFQIVPVRFSVGGRAANYFHGLGGQIVKIEPDQEDIGRTKIKKMFNY
jgi:hypothetical protein